MDLKGIIYLKSGTYLFRTDTAHKHIWAWEIHDEYDKPQTHKWEKMPKKGMVEYFDIDNPPQTVSYIPTLN